MTTEDFTASSYAVIVAGYKSATNIRLCVEEAYKNDPPPSEFILIINHYKQQPIQTQRILEYANSEPRITRFAYFSQNIGVARAWNLGMQMSTKSDFFIIQNDDCRIYPDSFGELLKPFVVPGVGIVAPQLGGFERDVGIVPMGFLLAYRKEMIYSMAPFGYDDVASPLACERELALRAQTYNWMIAVNPNVKYSHTHDISNHPNDIINYLGEDMSPKGYNAFQLKTEPVLEKLCMQYNEMLREKWKEIKREG